MAERGGPVAAPDVAPALYGPGAGWHRARHLWYHGRRYLTLDGALIAMHELHTELAALQERYALIRGHL
ncbi:MAG: hypothetical protein OHK0015_17860 [Chloroflexi bacterium OHK40]